MRHSSSWIALTLVLLSGLASGCARAAEPMEFIRVSPDGWNFETAHSHQRFVPFGGNLIFAYNGSPGWEQGPSLTILTQSNWDPETIRKVFAGAHQLHMNLMKVFLYSGKVIPDPQTNDTIVFPAMTPSLLERLDALFQIARENEIYISLTLAEWGMGTTQWFQDGGIFFGRRPEDGPGPDSFAIHRNFWKAIAERCKNEPALFSYNLAAEFNMPGGNWGANKKDLDTSGNDKNTWYYMLNDRWGTSHWRQWLADQYGTIDALNKAWGTTYADFTKFPQPDIVWDATNFKYTRPQAMIADYNSFKEWVSYRFLKNQADAIRSVDRGHMITAGLLPGHPALYWAGSAMYHSGILAKELDFLDYTTVHVYTQPNDAKPGQGPFTWALHNGVLASRFAHHPGKPIIAEEVGHYVSDFNETLTETVNVVNALVGHVSGYQIWLLTDAGGDFGPLDKSFVPNDWGRAWMKLAEPGGAIANLPKVRPRAKQSTR